PSRVTPTNTYAKVITQGVSRPVGGTTAPLSESALALFKIQPPARCSLHRASSSRSY
ncbi:hypothetical protein CDAR_570411, partial [Caerostris darwini]